MAWQQGHELRFQSILVGVLAFLEVAFMIKLKFCCAARSAFGRRAGRRGAPTGSEAQRSGAKWRGRGLGQRNAGFEKKLQYTLKI